MAVQRCGNGRYRIDSGPCVYRSRSAAKKIERKRIEKKQRRRGY